MKLALHNLCTMHPKLRGDPTDRSKFGGLALQRAGHSSPVQAAIVHDNRKSSAEIEWLRQDMSALRVLDRNRITEEGAEAVALAYVNSQGRWVVKRRMNRGESADWLLASEASGLVMEVAGTTGRDAIPRLRQKRQQVARCTLAEDYPVDLLAVVVAFREPSIFASRP